MSEPLKCCICLDVFTNPTSLPCGHAFCLGCIGEYWRVHGSCRCPLCMTHFPTRPRLQTGHAAHAETPATPLRAGEVPCDLCTAAGRRRAVKSCLVCLASYCDAHLELHYQREDLGRHLLVSVAKNLEEPVCRVHDKPLDRFCRSDQTCICAMCVHGEHRGHHIMPIYREAAKKKVKLKRRRTMLLQAIQERLSKVEKIKVCVGRCGENPAENKELLRRLEEEICELQRKNSELEQLSHSDDDLRFLQRFLYTS